MNGDNTGRYLRAAEAAGLAPTTIRQHRKVLGLARRRVTNLDAADTATLGAAVNRPGLAPATRRHYRAIPVDYYDWLVGAGVRIDNPAAGLPKPRLPRYLPRPTPEAQLAAALASASPRDRCWLTLMAYAGLRCCEVVRIRGEDVDFEARRLYVHGKGGVEGVVPMHPLVELELAPWLRRGRLFPTTREYVSQRVGAILHDVGAVGGAHGLRHRFATVMLRQCHDPSVVQQAMRHASISTTMVYAAVDAGRVVDAVAALPPWP